MNYATLKADLRRDEGVRIFPYDDATGQPPVLKGKLTIGCGHNLTDNGLPPALIDALLDLDIQNALRDLIALLPTVELSQLSERRQRALINMSFNLGLPRLAKFKGLLAAVKAGDWSRAAACARRSLWYTQVGARAVRICAMLEQG